MHLHLQLQVVPLPANEHPALGLLLAGWEVALHVRAQVGGPPLHLSFGFSTY